MQNRSQIFAAFVVSLLIAPLHVHSQNAETTHSPSNPLEAFERLIGGQWHLEGSYQEFQWGLGRQIVEARGYFVVDGEARLVSEGFWFWHPAKKEIKGIFTAIDMPMVLLEYSTRFEEDTMVNDVRSYGSNGDESVYVETWDFTDDAHYVWTLLRNTPDGLEQEMAGTYTRKQ